MTDKKDSNNEKNLFRSTIGGVKPIKHNTVNLRTPAIRLREDAQLRRQMAQQDKDAESHLTNHATIVATELTELTYKCAGVKERSFKQLKRGQYAMQAVLDLHGYTVQQANTQVFNFIQEASQQRLQCVLIIHGKGQHNKEQQQAKLKSHVASWLIQIPSVLAYHSAKPSHGGLGAVYVLLRKPK